MYLQIFTNVIICNVIHGNLRFFIRVFDQKSRGSWVLIRNINKKTKKRLQLYRYCTHFNELKFWLIVKNPGQFLKKCLKLIMTKRELCFIINVAYRLKQVYESLLNSFIETPCSLQMHDKAMPLLTSL